MPEKTELVKDRTVRTAPICPLCEKGIGLPSILAPGEVAATSHVCDRCGHQWKADDQPTEALIARESIEGVHFDVLYASAISPPVSSSIHKPLLEAIDQRTITELEFRDGSSQLGEPHLYGTVQGVPRLLFFDAHGDDPSWAFIDVRQVVAVKRWLKQHFTPRTPPPEFDPGE